MSCIFKQPQQPQSTAGYSAGSGIKATSCEGDHEDKIGSDIASEQEEPGGSLPTTEAADTQLTVGRTPLVEEEVDHSRQTDDEEAGTTLDLPQSSKIVSFMQILIVSLPIIHLCS